MTETIAEIVLTKPIETTTGETIETIHLKQPKTGDIVKIGQPVTVEFADGKINAKADPDKLAKYLPAMTGHPMLILEQMALPDMFLILGETEVFFTQQSVEMAGKMFSLRSDAQPENSQ